MVHSPFVTNLLNDRGSTFTIRMSLKAVKKTSGSDLVLDAISVGKQH